MAAGLNPRLTFDEYLEIEGKAEFKSEFVNGWMYAMAGASPEHKWLLTEFNDLQDTIFFPSINCHLSLADVYDKVKWPEAE